MQQLVPCKILDCWMLSDITEPLDAVDGLVVCKTT